MMRIVFSLLILLFGGLSFGQSVKVNIHYENKNTSEKSDTIYYQPSRKLTWPDFRGKPLSESIAGAVTASGYAFDANFHYDNNGRMILDIGVYCYFTKHDSWKKSEISSPYHLEHEQHHFDITYLGALDFITQLKKAKFTADNYSHLLSDIFNRSYDSNIRWQHQYDSETKNSIDKMQQELWNKKISEMLQEKSVSTDK